MKFSVDKLIVDQLKQELDTIDISNEDKLQKLEQSYEVSKKALIKLRAYYSTKKFRSKDAEIKFFKITKPFVLSNVITFSQLYGLETKRPQNHDKSVLKYYQNYIDTLQEYIDEKIDIYKYYRINSTKYDHQYFTRSNFDVKLYPEAASYCTDTEFSTSHDTIFATLMAYENIIIYVKQEIANIKRELKFGDKGLSNNLHWTGTKSDIVELMYALQASNVINHGNVTLKELSVFFEHAFNIRLDDYFRVFYDIQNRSQMTKFLDGLKEELENKINNSIKSRK